MYQSQVWAWQLRATRSESEFLEEEVGSCLLLASLVLSVSLLEFILKLFFECLAALRGVHLVFGGKRAEFEVLLDHESGREQVVIVNVLDERLHAGLVLDLFVAHGLGLKGLRRVPASLHEVAEYAFSRFHQYFLTSLATPSQIIIVLTTCSVRYPNPRNLRGSSMLAEPNSML